MNIKQAIDRADELSPNGFTKDQKVKWLSTLDHFIYEKIIKTHEGGEDVTFSGYGKETPDNTELFAEEPFDEMYLFYLMWHYDLANRDIPSYNNNAAVYTAKYDEYAAWYTQNHRPLQRAREVFF